ncbi:MAG: cephalosporin hydroxylase family protein [Desulfacinum sp.]|jgi:cephalosporin hydroxylase|nr:cephalosporin hydroxylase family protein [Desulfacinum sp.]
MPFNTFFSKVRKAFHGLPPFRKRPRLVKAHPYVELEETSLAEWLIYHQREVVFKQVTWMGIPTLKNVMDAWIYQEILYEVRPDVVVEIGSFTGGSTLYLAHLLDLLGHGTVVSIDVNRQRFVADHPRIVVLTGDSGAPDMVQRVFQICRGKKVLAIHDGDHRAEAVLKDLRNYSPLVTPGSYFIVEDGIVDVFSPNTELGWSDPGPLEAVRTFLKENKNFEADRSRERYRLTYNPDGYLRRVS